MSREEKKIKELEERIVELEKQKVREPWLTIISVISVIIAVWIMYHF